MKPERTFCPACGHIGVTHTASAKLQCSRCHKVGMLYVSMMSSADQKAIRLKLKNDRVERLPTREGGPQ